MRLLCSDGVAAMHPFPFVKTRVPVVGMREINLTPIEVAMEELAKRTRDLCSAEAKASSDAKRLELCLQGSILPQVNQGIGAYVDAFLAHDKFLSTALPRDARIEMLKTRFR